MDEKKFNGILVVYLNYETVTGGKADIDQWFELVKKTNQELFEKMRMAGYEVMIIPTIHEMTKVEKHSFDKWFESRSENDIKFTYDVAK